MKSMIDNPELGYTPNNLLALRTKFGLSQTQVAALTSVKNQQNVSRWESDFDNPLHSDMPATKWRMLLLALSEKQG